MKGMKDILFKIFGFVSFISTGLAIILWSDLSLTKEALKDARDVAESRRLIIEEQTKLTERENRLDRRLNSALRRIEEAPNAQVLVPPDVAVAWGNAINSVHDDESGANSGPEKLPRHD